MQTLPVTLQGANRSLFRLQSSNPFNSGIASEDDLIELILTPTLKAKDDNASLQSISVPPYQVIREIDRCRASVLLAENPVAGTMHVLKSLEAIDGDPLVSDLSSRHPSIVACEDFAMNNGDRYLVFPYVEGISLRQVITIIHNNRLIRSAGDLDIYEVNGGLNGDLAFKLKLLKESGFSEDEVLLKLKKRAIKSLADIAAALNNLKENRLSHGDLKPSNVILGVNGSRLIDFESTRKIGEMYIESPIPRTANYIAPEEVTFSGQLSQSQFLSEHGDVFNLSNILFQLLCGKHPFYRHEEMTEDRLFRKEPPHPIDNADTFQLNDLVMAGLGYEAKRRPTLQGFEQRLRAVL